MLQRSLIPKQITYYSNKAISILLFLVFCLFSKTDAQIVYVDSSVSVSGDGSSWANAYKELRDALNSVNANSGILEVDVAKGTYLTAAGTNQDSAFCIFRDNIKIVGGYQNGGGSRDVSANKVNLRGINGGYSTSTYHVMIIAGISTSADSIVLDGLTIANGLAISGIYSYSYNGQIIYGNTGAGLCLQGNSNNCKIAVRNCIVTQNSGNTGGGIYSYSTGSLFINNCSFDSNIGYGSLDAGVNSNGAGLYNYKTTTSVSNCSFTNNSMNRSGRGIGIYNEQATITIVNCSFNGNYGVADGGGITNINGASADISYCTFANNNIDDIFGYGHGGGIYNSSSAINLNNSTFIRNRFSGDGTLYLASSPVATINSVSFIQNSAMGSNTNGNSGGITSIASYPLISNCLFAMDTSFSGGAMYNGSGSSPTVSNCTFYRNFAETSAAAGGGVRCDESSGGKYSNCIFWGDTVYVEYAPFGRYEFYSENIGSDLSNPPPSISYSIIQSPFPVLNVVDSGNNSNEYPQFVDSANIAGIDGLYGTGDDGLRLQTSSPGIDAGINNAIPAGVTKDIKGDNRIFNNTVDMGCYENGSSFVTPATLLANDGDSTNRSAYGTLALMKDSRLIATVVPTGAAPVTEGIKAKVSIDQTGTLFVLPYVKRYYDIEPFKNAATSTATISLYFTKSDFDAYNLIRGSYPSLPTDAADAANYKSNIIVHQFHDASGAGNEVIIVPSNVTWSTVNNWWTVSFEVNGFSKFYINTSLGTLPVVLEYFKGQKQGSNNYLTWKVDCSNSPSLTLNLQKSIDGSVFKTLYSKTTSEQSCLEPFGYIDADPQAITNYYRLQIAESNNKITYSNTLFFSNTALEGIIITPEIIQRGQLLNVSVSQSHYTMIIYNGIGATIKQQELLQGINFINMAGTPGIYFYRIADQNRTVQKTGKIVVD